MFFFITEDFAVNVFQFYVLATVAVKSIYNTSMLVLFMLTFVMTR